MRYPPLQMAFKHREHTPDCLTKKILGNFLKAHLSRVEAKDDATRKMFWSTVTNFYVSTY